MADCIFKEDNHGDTKILTGAEETAYLIRAILFGIPGEDPLNPDKGVNLTSYINHRDPDTIVGELRRIINKQISDYTDIIVSSVEVVLNPTKDIIGVLFDIPSMDDLVIFKADSNGSQLDFISRNE